jgi:glyoxylase-like metal-dependent hydrolase (beta-lactamase superfamily II)
MTAPAKQPRDGGRAGDTYRFTIGTIECLAISAGLRAPPRNALSPGWIGLAAEPPGQGPPDPIVPTTCLLIDTGQHHVLIDTGAGAGQPGPGLLARVMSRGEIDTVVLSHAHPGHIGGALDGTGKPAFANARYVIWREERDFWMAEPDLRSRGLQGLVASASEHLVSLGAQLDLVDRDAEIVSGIHLVASPGHSAGHSAVAVVSGGERLLYLADTVFEPAHLGQPLWYSPADLRPEQSVNSRLRLLDRAVAEQALVHAAHFPFPGLGRVIQRGEAWEWQPVEPVDPEPPPGAARLRAAREEK